VASRFLSEKFAVQSILEALVEIFQGLNICKT